MTRFWEDMPLDRLDRAQWEQLCDGCGKCCVHKLEDEETGELLPTNVACRLLNLDTCQCTKYATRHRYVPDCVTLTPAEVRSIDWLPPSCAYRLLAEGKPLQWWHPLVSGTPETVHQAGISVRGRAVGEREAGPLDHHLVDWPGKLPRPRKPAARNKPETP